MRCCASPRSDHERLRLHDLATQLDLSNSGASRLVDRLEGRGLVSRVACDTDRRGAYAVITDQGRALVEGAIVEHLELIERYYTGVLEPDELDTLSALAPPRPRRRAPRRRSRLARARA